MACKRRFWVDPLNLLGGFQWANAAPLDVHLRRAIFDAEIGGKLRVPPREPFAIRVEREAETWLE